MSSGEAACMLLPSKRQDTTLRAYADVSLVGVGAVIAVFVFLWYDHFLAKSKARGKAWAQLEEYRRLPLACAGGPLFAMSQFWLVGYCRIQRITVCLLTRLPRHGLRGLTSTGACLLCLGFHMVWVLT